MSVLKKNLVFNTLLSLSQLLFPLITFPYVSRILGPSGVGQVNFVDSITQYFMLFAAVGIPLYGVRELSKLKHDVQAKSKLFTELVCLHLITTSLFLLAYLVLIFLFQDRDIPNSLFFIGCGILFSNAFIVEWYYQSQEKFDYITKRTILLRIVFIIMMFCFVKTRSDIVIYYGLFLILQISNAGLNFYLVFKTDLRLVFTGMELRKHIQPLLFLTACAVIGSVYVLLDNVILGILGTAASVGYYSSAVKITKIPIGLINALGIVLVPRLSESFSRNDFETIKYYINGSLHYVVTLGVPLVFGIFLTAEWTILIISGQEFIPAVVVLKILSPVVLLIALNCIYFFQLFTPGNKERTMIIILLVSAIISVLLNLVLIPKFGHVGTGITTTVTECSVLMVSVYFSRRLFNIGLNWSLFIRPVAASLIFVPIIYLVDQTTLNLFTKFALGGGTCAVCYFLIQRFIFHDIIIVKMEDFVKTTLKLQRNG